MADTGDMAAVPRHPSHRSLLVCAVLLWLGGPAMADATDDRRALAMLRVVAYDNNLVKRAGDTVTVIILYPASEAGAADSGRWTTAFSNASKLKINGKTVVVGAIRFENARNLDRSLRDRRTAALLVCPGLTAKIPEVVALTRAHKVLSITTVESEVANGLSVGLVPGKTRDELVVNVTAATAEGVKFDAGLLQLARTVGSP
ncbi:MAG: YfiR family protein [Kofleriaceae bacterium]